MAVKNTSGRPWKKGQSGNPNGRPKGAKGKRTIAVQMEEDAFREKVKEHLAPILDAQVANAQGIKYLVVRQRKGGKFVRVHEVMAKGAKAGKLGKDEEIIEVWEKDPSVQAFSELLNRAYGKSKETVDVTIKGDLEARIQEGRKRVARGE